MTQKHTGNKYLCKKIAYLSSHFLTTTKLSRIRKTLENSRIQLEVTESTD